MLSLTSKKLELSGSLGYDRAYGIRIGVACYCRADSVLAEDFVEVLNAKIDTLGYDLVTADNLNITRLGSSDFITCDFVVLICPEPGLVTDFPRVVCAVGDARDDREERSAELKSLSV